MFVTAVVVAAVAPVRIDEHGCSAKHGPAAPLSPVDATV